jgi:hypothetical protein
MRHKARCAGSIAEHRERIVAERGAPWNRGRAERDIRGRGKAKAARGGRLQTDFIVGPQAAEVPVAW